MLDFSHFPEFEPDPYERQMGVRIERLIRLFSGRVRDQASHCMVLELVSQPKHWRAGHAAFDEIRQRQLAAHQNDLLLAAQYSFEESCCQAVYNATYPHDPFDASSPFFVVPMAIVLAARAGISPETISKLFTSAR